MELDLAIPDHSTLSRRLAHLDIELLEMVHIARHSR